MAAAGTATTSATAIQVPRTCSESSLRRPNGTAVARTKGFHRFPVTNIPSSRRPTTVSVILASKSQEEDVNSDTPAALIPQEDVNYLLRLGAGSVLGAAAIKYGSILLPEITRPNIIQALAMISAPVVVAVLLLIKSSRLEQ